jgi:hypothetical protein
MNNSRPVSRILKIYRITKISGSNAWKPIPFAPLLTLIEGQTLLGRLTKRKPFQSL